MKERRVDLVATMSRLDSNNKSREGREATCRMYTLKSGLSVLSRLWSVRDMERKKKEVSHHSTNVRIRSFIHSHFFFSFVFTHSPYLPTPTYLITHTIIPA